MVIEIKNADLRDANFSEAIHKISMYRGFRARQLDNVSRIVKQLEKENERVQREFINCVKNYATLDSKGNFIPLIKGDGTPVPGTFVVSEEKKEAWEKAQEEFTNTTIRIGGFQLPSEDLDGVGLNALEWSALSPLLRGLKLVEGGENEEKSEEKGL